METLHAFTDFEASGLDIPTLSPLEVAVKLVMVGPDGIIRPENVLFTYDSLIQPLDPDWASNCHPAALDMHQKNGLIDAFREAESIGAILPTVQETSVVIAKGFQEVIDELASPDGVEIFMAGMGVANYDRPLVREHMKEWSALMHYRSVDISGFIQTMKAMKRNTGGDANPICDNIKHRAGADVDQGIAAFNFISASNNLPSFE